MSDPENGEHEETHATQQIIQSAGATAAAAEGHGGMGGGMMGMGGMSAVAGGALGGGAMGGFMGNRNNYNMLGHENSAWAASQPAMAEQPAAKAAAPAATETVNPTTTAPRINSTKHAHTASMSMSGPSFN